MSLRTCSFLVLVLFPLTGALGQSEKVKVPLVTIQDRSVPLEQAIKSFSVQTGLAVDVSADLKGSTPLSLDLKQVPLWKALDAIAEQAGARAYLFRGDGRPALVKRAEGARLFVSHDGIFRVAVRRLRATSDFETGSRSTTATLEVAWDPRFLPVDMENRPRALVVHDAAGKPLKPAAGSLWSAIDGRMAQTVDVTLPSPPREDNRFGLLKGEFLVRGAARMLTFQFGGLDTLDAAKKPVVKEQDGVSCSVTEVKLRKVWTIQVTTKLPPGGPDFESFQLWDVLNEIYLLHKKDGTRMTSTSLSRDTAGSNKAVVNYHFDLSQQKRVNPADWVLVYRAPAGLVELAVPFEFKDVPLP